MKATVLLFFQNKAAGTRYAVTSPSFSLEQLGVSVNTFLRLPSRRLEKSRNI